ncbi:polyprenyl diphosphate synthase [Sulfuracidifex metallicus]|uniref:Tritrans,polycis-undecaprenyl-diphosphate synthase (geranylgeranyl-diphosphate specific) n=1 Tax=Sulfuracidifex metallicus DSM 6482 = JCM 9184 TaxID=523847 RepID=A0A6A9QJ92_SULME|nr:polyprenyl diphosphate synthase [Sulfuracidifex metallicus]MUN28734.1 di-trans,poly-cis-decaprenylcistransferase [Sulfuracidifex metallicus DSM 6482 = JCM 9184]WOE50747.1 polyprenyl diphosphate synthase [Sulfuracidifex metallicus DSM 6482 = JCM 9184]
MEKIRKDILMKPIYDIYEKFLWKQISKGPFPTHVAIIPDGNRRWARLRGAQLEEAYLNGYKKLREVLIWLLDMGVTNISVFALSTENCERRNRDELNIVMRYIKKGLEDLLHDELIERNEVRVNAIGKLELLPRDMIEMIDDVIERTSKYSKRKLTLAICYGGRQEILDAVARLLKEYKSSNLLEIKLDEESFKKYFYDSELSDIDLVIRTSGEVRISNFLLWHMAYSELFFCDAYWPDFRKIDLWRAIRSYQRRKRNYGA